MSFLSDLLIAAAALGAGIYCVVLARRLKALTSLEGGMGTAIAVLSSQVDDLTRSLKDAQTAATNADGRLTGQTARAEAVARKLELLVASMHDLPDMESADPPAGRAPTRWPTEAGRRPPAEASPPPEQGPAPRARILRRRQGQEGDE